MHDVDGTPTGTRASRVFISYSRNDAEFAFRLVEALRGRAFDAYIDRDDIHPAEPWKERLNSLIVNADAVVFAISPDSADSDICSWEVDRAQARSKRLVPVLWRAVRAASVQHRLVRLNWISFEGLGLSTLLEDADWRDAVERLVAAVTSDIDWVREHTWLVDLAVR